MRVYFILFYIYARCELYASLRLQRGREREREREREKAFEATQQRRYERYTSFDDRDARGSTQRRLGVSRISRIQARPTIRTLIEGTRRSLEGRKLVWSRHAERRDARDATFASLRRQRIKIFIKSNFIVFVARGAIRGAIRGAKNPPDKNMRERFLRETRTHLARVASRVPASIRKLVLSFF